MYWLASLAKRRRWPLLSLGLIAVLAGLAGWLLLPSDPIGPEAFDRIQLGMTEEEVEAVFGLPAGDYYSNHNPGPATSWPLSYVVAANGVSSDYVVMSHPNSQQWYGDRYWMEVCFDENGKVFSVLLYQFVTYLAEPSYVDRLRQRLGL